jgi:predicted nucleic acid-binding protein
MLELLGAAHNYKLTTYDSMYLLLIMHESLDIVTKDRALINRLLRE